VGRSLSRAVIGSVLAFGFVLHAPLIAGAAATKKPVPAVADACQIVTQAAAAEFLGTPVAQSGSGSSCDYAGNGGIAAVTVRVRTLSGPDVAFTKKQIKSAKNATALKLGDAASEAITPGGGGGIQVLKGKVLLDVSVRKSDASGQQVVALDPTAFATFARAAFGRLYAKSSSGSSSSSSSSASSSSATPLDPCQVVTPEEVAIVLGGTVTATPAGSQDCDFRSNAGKTLRVTVATGKPRYETDAKHFTGTHVSGLGDVAFLAQPNGLVGFLKGQHVVEMQTSSALVSQDDVNALEDLARKAAARA